MMQEPNEERAAAEPTAEDIAKRFDVRDGATKPGVVQGSAEPPAGAQVFSDGSVKAGSPNDKEANPDGGDH